MITNSDSLIAAEDLPVTHRTYKSLPPLETDQASLASIFNSEPGLPQASAAASNGLHNTPDLNETTPLPELQQILDANANADEQGRGFEVTLRTREMAWIGSADDSQPEYVLQREIGAGGMGTVYEAQQACVGRAVAIKVLKPEFAGMSHAVKAFTAEGAVTAELEHPGIVPLYDLGHSELTGAPFYAMKQVHGHPWSKVIDSQTNSQRVEVLLRICDAVAFAHSRGVLHRDLKPDNVMLGDFGEVLVMDWGLAVSIPVLPGQPASELVRSPRATPVTESTFGGTPAYMAPELTGPDLTKIGVGSDVYLLGAVLWRAITGRPPHIGETLPECVHNARENIIAEPPESVTIGCKELGTTELIAIARKAMATDIADRYESVPAFQAALRDWQTHAESAALTRRAANLLIKAAGQMGGGYQGYAMAVFTYEEALSLWSANPCATDGLISARLAYARAALKRGDFELADSVLAEGGIDPRTASLAAEIQAARKERACSEHHRATLARTAEKWSLAFELSPDAMVILRQEDSVVLEANANFEKATGWPRNEVIGHSTAQINLWADPEARTDFISMLRDNGEVQGFTARFRRRSGEIYNVLVSAVLAEFDGIQAVVANSRDISNVRL